MIGSLLSTFSSLCSFRHPHPLLVSARCSSMTVAPKSACGMEPSPLLRPQCRLLPPQAPQTPLCLRTHAAARPRDPGNSAISGSPSPVPQMPIEARRTSARRATGGPISTAAGWRAKWRFCQTGRPSCRWPVWMTWWCASCRWKRRVLPWRRAPKLPKLSSSGSGSRWTEARTSKSTRTASRLPTFEAASRRRDRAGAVGDCWKWSTALPPLSPVPALICVMKCSRKRRQSAASDSLKSSLLVSVLSASLAVSGFSDPKLNIS